MGLNSAANRVICPCCNFGAEQTFEKTTICSLRGPYTPGVYDELAIMPGSKMDVFKCLRCGYILGLNNAHPLQQIAFENKKRIFGE